MNFAPKHVAVITLVAVAPWIIATAINEDHVRHNSTTVTIVGQGTAPQEAQLLTMQAGVTTFATTAGQAWGKNARAMAGLRSELKGQGISDIDIRTEGINLSERTKHENGDDIKGFGVHHNITIVFRDINRTGAILDALVEAGANNIMGPRFSSEAGSRVQQLARKAAIQDANQRAAFYAKSLGLKVRRVVAIRDSNGYASQQPSALRTNYTSATDVSPGEDTVRLTHQR
jgi:uncharacterized protein YggE